MITKINEDLKQAMRDKDTTKLNVLRALKSSITNASLLKGNVNEALSDIELIGIVRKEVSKRQDSINSFVSSMRDDLILKENNEIQVLNDFLPEEMDDEDLNTIVDVTISMFDNPTKKDMGKIIKSVMERVDGRVDGKRISKMVGEKL